MHAGAQVPRHIGVYVYVYMDMCAHICIYVYICRYVYIYIYMKTETRAAFKLRVEKAPPKKRQFHASGLIPVRAPGRVTDPRRV